MTIMTYWWPIALSCPYTPGHVWSESYSHIGLQRPGPGQRLSNGWISVKVRVSLRAFENVQSSTEGLGPEQRALASEGICPNACGPVMRAGSQPSFCTPSSLRIMNLRLPFLNEVLQGRWLIIPCKCLTSLRHLCAVIHWIKESNRQES